ncbi:MAG: OsmC family protein [Alphaproteobacteria bacterium]
MADPHVATVNWRRDTDSFAVREYNTTYHIAFDGGASLPGSTAPALGGDPSCVDPEEAFVAALAGCHMLSFLYCAARAEVVVDAYEDAAEGYMTKAEDKLPWVSKVTLRPKVTLADPAQADQLERLHEKAHAMCFIARSVKSEVTIEPAA